MKECFLITAYCETDEKLFLLSNTIDNLKSVRPNSEIYIHSHYPLETEIQNKVNSCIFSSSNPIIPWYIKGVNVWIKLDAYKLNHNLNDYSWAVLTQWKESIPYIFSNNFDKIIVINYDVTIDDKFYIDNLSGESIFFSGINSNATSGIFSICKDDHKNFIDHINEQNYTNFYNAEEFLFNYIKNTSIKLKPLDKNEDRLLFSRNVDLNGMDYKEEITEASAVFLNFNFKDKCKIFGGKHGNNFVIILYHIKNPIEVRIIFDKKTFEIKTNYDKIFINTFMTFEKFEQCFGYLNNNAKLIMTNDRAFDIYIDNDKVDDKIISKFLNNIIE